jgi:chemotaxis protein MotB
MSKNQGDIVIKKIKKSAAGHHGGAWKVAYADFVTAMMAFFLLLWLLNATEAENLAGLADYFAPTVGVKDEMGIGFRGGKAVLSDGIGADKNTNKGIVFGGVPTGPITKVTTQIEERTDQDKQEQIKVIIDKTDTNKKGSEDEQNKLSSTNEAEKVDDEKNDETAKTAKALDAYVEDMVKNKRIDEGAVEIKRTPEGLVIEIKDVSGDSMFEKDTTDLKQKLKDALAELAKILKNVPNNLALVGHTSSATIQTKSNDYTKWELSADRANATRSFLEKNGIQPEQISRVEGRADNVPYDKRKPESSVNNRIAIIILNKNDTPGHKKSAPDSLLIDVKGNQAKKFIENSEQKATENPSSSDSNSNKKGTTNNEFKNILEETSKIPEEANKSEGKKAVPSNNNNQKDKK